MHFHAYTYGSLFFVHTVKIWAYFQFEITEGETTEKVKLPNLNLISANDLTGINSGQHLGVRHRSYLAPDGFKEQTLLSLSQQTLPWFLFRTTAWWCGGYWAPLKEFT